MIKPQNFKVGDRVARRITLTEPDERFGFISFAYYDTPGNVGGSPTPLYKILWDDSMTEEIGYLECGIRKVGDGEATRNS